MNLRKRTDIPVLILAVTAMVHFLSGTAFCGGVAEEAKKKFPAYARKDHIMPEGGAFFKPSNPKALTGSFLECANLPTGNSAAPAGIGAVALPGNSPANNALIAQSLTPNTTTFNPSAFNAPAINNPSALNIYRQLAAAAMINQAITSSLPIAQDTVLTANIGQTSTLNPALPLPSDIAGTASLNNSIAAAIQTSSAISANGNTQNNISGIGVKKTSKSVSPALAPLPAALRSDRTPAHKTRAVDLQKTKSIAEAAKPEKTFIRASSAKNVSATKSAGTIFNIIRSRSATIANSLKDLLISVNKTRKTAVNAAVRKQLAVIAELKELLPLIRAHKNTLQNNISAACVIAMSKTEHTIASLRYLPETFSRFIRNKLLPIIRILKDPREMIFPPTAFDKETGLPYHALPMEQYPSDPAANRINDTDSGSNNNCSIVISRTVLNDILARKALLSAPSQTIQDINYSRTGLSPPAKDIKTSSSRTGLFTLYPRAGSAAVHSHVFDSIAESFKTSHTSHSFSGPTTFLFAAHHIFSLNNIVAFEHKGLYIRMGGFFCFNMSGSQDLGSARRDI